MYRNLLVISGLVVLSACVSSSKTLTNAQGQSMYCNANGWGWLGAPMALASQSDCVANLKRQGFYEAGKTPNDYPIKPSAISYPSKVALALPPSWVPQPITPDLQSSGARIYAADLSLDASIMVSAIKRSAVTDLQRYLQSRKAASMIPGSNPVGTEIVSLAMAGRQAFAFEVERDVGAQRLRYLHVLFVGQEEVAYVSAWASAGNFAAVKPDLERLVGTVMVN